jgi:hypothetical protein
MRSVVGFAVAVFLAVGGITAASLAVPVLESPALAQKAQKSKTASQKPRPASPRTTGFEHQQCTVQDPCSTRNQH